MGTNNAQTTQDETNVEYLKERINGLINEYIDASRLLNEQMQVVIQNDMSSLNKLIEKQTVIYETLKELELDFNERLHVLHHPDPKTTNISLPRVLNQLQGPAETLNVLRGRLHTQLRETEKLRTQLIDLLYLTRRQNTEVGKTIGNLGSDTSDATDGPGQKTQQPGNAAP